MTEHKVNKRLHILGIGGTFMGNLALLAKELGYQVTGYDKVLYPPISDLLARADIAVVTDASIDYNHGRYLAALPEQKKPDAVIVGNALTRGHPLIEYLLDASIPLWSGPAWLYRNVLHKKHVIAVAGTHGKTTLTTMLAWMLTQLGRQPGYLIGGVPEDLEYSASLGKSNVFVLEADEYDTAFFDKRSKFLHYHPKTLIINNLEYDHADIYPDLAAIQTQFHHLIKTLPASGHIIYPADQEAITQVLQQGCWSQQRPFHSSFPSSLQNTSEPAKPKQSNQGYSYQLTQTDGSAFVLLKDHRIISEIKWPLLGKHNIHNLIAGLTALDCLGIDTQPIYTQLTEFHGVKRRLELIMHHEASAIRLYNDFAHHPSAIACTLEALKASIKTNPYGKLIAVIVPASNTMRSGQHQHQLAQAVQSADFCLWLVDQPIQWPINTILNAHADCCTMHELDHKLQPQISHGCTIVLMTNGESGMILHALRQLIQNTDFCIHQHKTILSFDNMSSDKQIFDQ